MTDFLNDLINDTGLISREVTLRGKTGPVYFRRISAGERAMLVKGQKITGSGANTSVEIDLGESITAQHMLVQFSVCNEDGGKKFRTLKEVQSVDSGIVEALYQIASEVNREEADAGK